MRRANISNSYYLFCLLISVFTVSYTSETPDQYPGLQISHGLLWPPCFICVKRNWNHWPALSWTRQQIWTRFYCEVTPGSFSWDMCWCLSVISVKNLHDAMLNNNSEGQVCFFFSELWFGSLKMWHCFKILLFFSGVDRTCMLFLWGSWI